MRNITVLLVIVLFVSDALVAPALRGADLAATAVHGFWPSRTVGDPMGLLFVNLLLKNQTERTIRVPTRCLDSYLFAKGDRAVLHLVIKPRRFDDDIIPITPEVDLRIVDLRPGEVAWVAWQQSCEAMPKKPLYVRFEVDRDLAARYGLWSGEIEVQSILGSERERQRAKQKTGR